MKNKAAKLIKLWRSLDLKKGPYVLHEDSALLEDKEYVHSYRDFSSFIADPDFGKAAPKACHVNLLPIPYCGNILKAKVYILLINPGFGVHDYYAESKDEGYRRAVENNLRQTKFNSDFPMFLLNPQFSWTGGGRYWTRKMANIVDVISHSKKISYVDSLKFLSQRLAIIEYVPYHSKRFGLPKRILNHLESSKQVYDFVHSILVPKATAGKVCLIVTRHSKTWNIRQKNQKNIVIYTSGEARSAHLSEKSSGGSQILRFLLQM